MVNTVNCMPAVLQMVTKLKNMSSISKVLSGEQRRSYQLAQVTCNKGSNKAVCDSNINVVLCGPVLALAY